MTKIEPLLGALIGLRPTSASTLRAKVSTPPLTGVPASVSSLVASPPPPVLLLPPPHAQRRTPRIRNVSRAAPRSARLEDDGPCGELGAPIEGPIEASSFFCKQL